MAKVNVLNEILKWSLDRPPWQRDALRRLVTKAELDETDIGELSNLCKSRHGLGDREKPVPLNANHLPQSDARKKPVSLESLTHHVGVCQGRREQQGRKGKTQYENGPCFFYGDRNQPALTLHGLSSHACQTRPQGDEG